MLFFLIMSERSTFQLETKLSKNTSYMHGDNLTKEGNAFQVFDDVIAGRSTVVYDTETQEYFPGSKFSLGRYADFDLSPLRQVLGCVWVQIVPIRKGERWIGYIACNEDGRLESKLNPLATRLLNFDVFGTIVILPSEYVEGGETDDECLADAYICKDIP